MKSFTHEYMKENCGCYKVDQLMKCSFMQSEPVTLQSIIDSEIPVKDKFWFLCNKVLTKEQNQRIAIELAKSVLHIYENEYPEDKSVRNAIQGAEDYLAGKISIEEFRQLKSAAADAAYAANAAANAAAYAAAYAAADAAYAAYAANSAYAANAAAYAAYAAAYAAYAANAANASAAAQKEILIKYATIYYQPNKQ